jgi:hypothetical protein
LALEEVTEIDQQGLPEINAALHGGLLSPLKKIFNSKD